MPLSSRPERDVGRRRPLRLQRGEPFDRWNDRDLLAREEHLAREHRAIQLAQSEDARRDGWSPSASAHAFTPWVALSG